MNRKEELIVLYIDGKLKEEQLEEFEKLLREKPELYREVEEQKKLKEVMDMIVLKNPDRAWEEYWKSLYNRIERGIGWIFFSIGAIILLTYGIIEWIQAVLKDVELPMFAKIGLFVLVFGFVVLLISILRERIFVSRRDKYSKEVHK